MVSMAAENKTKLIVGITVSNFYPDLEEAVIKAEEDLEKVQIRDEVSEVVCEQCGRDMEV